MFANADFSALYTAVANFVCLGLVLKRTVVVYSRRRPLPLMTCFIVGRIGTVCSDMPCCSKEIISISDDTIMAPTLLPSSIPSIEMACSEDENVDSNIGKLQILTSVTTTNGFEFSGDIIILTSAVFFLNNRPR